MNEIKNEYIYYQLCIHTMLHREINLRVKKNDSTECSIQEIIDKIHHKGELPYDDSVCVEEDWDLDVDVCDIDECTEDDEIPLFELDVLKNKLIKISS